MRENLILIVDDDPDVRTILTVGLEHEGFRVTTASNGLEGLEAIEREPPSLVLLDLHMPVLDGWGFARGLNHQVPFVVMSSDPDGELHAEELGAAWFFPKPFRLRRVLSKVEELMHAA